MCKSETSRYNVLAKIIFVFGVACSGISQGKGFTQIRCEDRYIKYINPLT